MNNEKPIGVIAFDAHGQGYDQCGAILVCGLSRKGWLASSLQESGEIGFTVREVFAAEIFQSLELGGAPVAFDRESFRLFDSFATTKYYSPTGTFEFGFYEEKMDVYIIFSAKHSDS